MNISTIRRYKKNNRFLSKIKVFKRNPVILLGISLPFVMATAISLKNAVAMSIEFFVINIVTAFIAVFFANRTPYWARAIVNVGVATLVMMGVRMFITWWMPDIYNYLGTYIYLMALNGMVLLEASGTAPQKRIRLGTAMNRSIKSVLANSLLFASLMLLIALPREYLGNGTLWGHTLTSPIRLSGMLLPFYGFISVGFLAAVIKFIYRGAGALAVKEAERNEIREKENYTHVVVKK